MLRTLVNFSLFLTLGWGWALAGPAELREAAQPSKSVNKSYFCPPCGCASDEKVFEKAGSCPDCHMALISTAGFSYRNPVKAVLNQPASPPKIGILVFEGVQIIDYTGPYEVFGQTASEVFTVGKQRRTIVTNMGMEIKPTYDFAGCPDLDVLVIPGGGVTGMVADKGAISWIKTKAQAAAHVLTVCNGAFILAQTGLLNGKKATTTFALLDDLALSYPEIEVVRDQRFVDNGKIVTAAGLSSGIDGSLYLVEKIGGLAVAQRTALGIEYNWQRGHNYVRANLADKLLRPKLVSGRYTPLMNAPDTSWRLENVQGDQQSWQVTWSVTANAQADSLLGFWDTKLRADSDWQHLTQRADTKTALSRWAFKDDHQRPWSGEVSVKRRTKETFEVNLRIQQSGESPEK